MLFYYPINFTDNIHRVFAKHTSGGISTAVRMFYTYFKAWRIGYIYFFCFMPLDVIISAIPLFFPECSKAGRKVLPCPSVLRVCPVLRCVLCRVQRYGRRS